MNFVIIGVGIVAVAVVVVAAAAYFDNCNELDDDKFGYSNSQKRLSYC
jgi:hypothetical protein